MDAGRKKKGKITLKYKWVIRMTRNGWKLEDRVRTNATVITDAAKVASDELTDWRELASDRSTVSISWENDVISGLRTCSWLVFSPC